MAKCDFLILTDGDGGTLRLTTDSPASHYRIPVLVADAADLSGHFGPADRLGASGLTAADLVVHWATQAGRSPEELAAARLFLGQWPESAEQLPAHLGL